MTTGSRRTALRLLEEEADLILQRAQLPGADELLYNLHHLRWYLSLSKNWGVVVLEELLRLEPGNLLDVGGFYCLISGATCRAGWKATAVDVFPVPSYSGLRDESREGTCAECNVCVDPLPFPDASFDVVLFTEVLEHLAYSPLVVLREIRRVLRPGGKLILTTPHAASLGKLLQLLRGVNPEPTAELFCKENDTYNYKGLTFFKSGRETRIWTAKEVNALLEKVGLEVADRYYYANTLTNGESALHSAKIQVSRLLRPLLRRSPLLGGGGMFFLAEKPA